jgi:hypothetical protein
MPTYRSDKNPVRFSDGDTARLLDILATESGGQLTMADFASCDVRLPPRKEGKEADQQPLIVVLGLTSAPDPDVRLMGGCAELERGFKPEQGAELVLKSDEAVSGTQVARVCLVLTRASNAEVRTALIERGVPSDAILRVSAATVAKTGVHKLEKVIHLVPGYPLLQIPWKIPLEEPGSCLEPHRVTVQGSHCAVCRSAEHRKKACPAYKQDLCGRCDFSFSELKAQGRNASNHDCEGGPAGYGADHLDLSGDKWHKVWTKWRDRELPCEVTDTFAEARNNSLAVAKAAAAKQKAKRAAKKEPRPARSEGGETDTPPAKRAQLERPPGDLSL